VSILSQPHFHNEDAARARLEEIVWPHGPVCPRCGAMDRISVVGGKTARPGLLWCGACDRQFTVTVGTLFERSKVPLHKWFQAAHLLASSKKGISAHQLHRTLQVQYKTAWFMEHRLREAMRSGPLAAMGGVDSIIEVDETFIGRKPGVEARPGWVHHKHAVLTLVERGGEARSFHIDDATKENIVPIVRANIARESHLMTDEARRYERLGTEFAGHGVVDHTRGEYGYTDRKTGTKVNTNTVEGYYSIFKRGMKGVYQHCSEQHLHRYLAEFDFRYSNRAKLGVDDEARTTKALHGIVGKRLTYRESSVAEEPL
jgi:transposase-like protein